MDVVLETYYILLPIVATALIGWVGYLLKEQKIKEQKQEAKNEEKFKEVDRIRKANSEGTKLILRYMLNRYHTEYMMQDKMTYGQYKDWMELFNAYRALGGNSIAMDWNDDIEKLDKCDYMDRPTLFESMIKRSSNLCENETDK